jgi:6-pyruvoyltetrahydropterin/6-carboxytetrahydropterin synthase
MITKTYPHSLGLSCCFRQPEATSHCRDPHGYPLEFELKFVARELDENNWVLDFGGLKPVKQMLIDTFDHRTILADDDPALYDFQILYRKYGFREIFMLPAVGCEAFATYVANEVTDILSPVFTANAHRGLALVSVECREHAGNSATYFL